MSNCQRGMMPPTASIRSPFWNFLPKTHSISTMCFVKPISNAFRPRLIVISKILRCCMCMSWSFVDCTSVNHPSRRVECILDARDFHNMLANASKEPVVIDVRNCCEAALGQFDGQEHEKPNQTSNKNGNKQGPKQQSSNDNDSNATASACSGGGAKCADPEMRKSADFLSWVEKAAYNVKGKRVMMCCAVGEFSSLVCFGGRTVVNACTDTTAIVNCRRPM